MLRRKGRKRMRRSTGYKPRSVGRIKGRGWYGADLGTIGGALAGGYVGSAIGLDGTIFGGGLGSSVGGGVGRVIDRIAGHGAYGVQANSILAPVQEGVSIPAFGNMKQATRIRHREFITDITANGATAFTLISYPLNPGLQSTFPWLAGVASNYDAYQILGMVFEFKTTSSDNVTSSGGPLGSVVMSTDYDTVDANYSTKLEMENSQYCVSSKPSLDILHCIECAPNVSFSPIKFIRSTAVPSGKDARLYDHGNFQLATVGLAASAGNIGELWVSYDILLYKPSLTNSIDYSNAIDHFKLPTTISSSHYFGADTTTSYNGATGSTLGGYVKDSVYYFPANVTSGNYMIIYTVVGASTTLTNNFGTASKTNCVSWNAWASDTVDYQEVSAGAVSTTQLFMEGVTVQAAVASISLAGQSGTLPGTISSGDLYVLGVPLPQT